MNPSRLTYWEIFQEWKFSFDALLRRKPTLTLEIKAVDSLHGGDSMSENEVELPEYWPRLGQHLFVPGSPGRDAEIALGSGERMFWMKKAFKNTADFLVTRTEENYHERRELVWPIVFCYRQYIELALKDVIAKHGSQVNPTIQPIWNTHKLGELWKCCKDLVEHTLLSITTADIPELVAM
jgi:hypothetical protein